MEIRANYNYRDHIHIHKALTHWPSWHCPNRILLAENLGWKTKSVWWYAASM